MLKPRGDKKKKKSEFYIQHLNEANNWDLDVGVSVTIQLDRLCLPHRFRALSLSSLTAAPPETRTPTHYSADCKGTMWFARMQRI